MKKKKKKIKVREEFTGEYSGNWFRISKLKRPADGKKYQYYDADIGTRKFTKKQYNFLKKNSEILYNEKKKKSVRCWTDKY